MPIQLTVHLERARQPGGYVFDLAQGEINVGRSPRCQLQLPFSFVSHHHLTIVAEGHGYFVSDNNSTNGTVLNDRRLPPHAFTPIADGDTLQIGDVTIAVKILETLTQPITLEVSNEHVRHMVWDMLDQQGDGALPSLEVVRGPDVGDRLELSTEMERVTVGRAPGCQLTLNDPMVHDEHVALIQRHGCFCVEPLNGQPVLLGRAPLRVTMHIEDDARLVIGGTELCFKDPLQSYLHDISRLQEGEVDPMDDLMGTHQIVLPQREEMVAPPELGPPDRPPVPAKPQLVSSDPGMIDDNDMPTWGAFEAFALVLALIVILGALAVLWILF